MTILAITAIDFVKPIFMLIFGLVMIFSPRSLMWKAKYDEEGVKAESWVKKIGIILCVAGIAIAIYYIYKMSNA